MAVVRLASVSMVYRVDELSGEFGSRGGGGSMAGLQAPLAGSRVWTKICGLTDVSSAEVVAAAGPSAVGLNFYSRSARFVSDQQAARIAAVIPRSIFKIGVFVNEPWPEVVRRIGQIGLDGVQFHGDETVEYVAEFQRECPQVPVIQAFRRTAAGIGPLISRVQRCRDLGVSLAACLIDAWDASAYGGTGQTLPWRELGLELQTSELPPVVLAGGLNPLNIAEAIRDVRPFGVDVASGVESSPGIKDAARVRQLVERVAQSPARVC